VFGRADIFRVLLYCYSLLAMSTVSVTQYTNIVVTYIWASNDTGDGKLMCRKTYKWEVWGGKASMWPPLVPM